MLFVPRVRGRACIPPLFGCIVGPFSYEELKAIYSVPFEWTSCFLFHEALVFLPPTVLDKSPSFLKRELAFFSSDSSWMDFFNSFDTVPVLPLKYASEAFLFPPTKQLEAEKKLPLASLGSRMAGFLTKEVSAKPFP